MVLQWTRSTYWGTRSCCHSLLCSFDTKTSPFRWSCSGRDQHTEGQDLAAVSCFAPLTQWPLCSGGPPVDEINILRGEILLLQNQVMYERHKRSNHAMRNRRLLRRIAHVSALEEQVQALVRILVDRATSTWQRNRLFPFPALEVGRLRAICSVLREVITDSNCWMLNFVLKHLISEKALHG